MSSTHAQPPAPAAPVPPRTIRIKRPRDEVPVHALLVNEPTAKKPKTADASATPAPTPAYVFRLAHTVSKFQPAPAEGLVRKVPSLEGASKSRKRLSSFDVEAMRAAESEEDVTKRRKIAPVRKYQLSRKPRHSPYGGSPRHAAVFERVRDEEVKVATPVVTADAETGKATLEEPKKERKRPRTHPKEKEMLRERREKADDKLTLGYEDDEKLMREMEKMVLDYLNADTNDGIKNLPPSQPAAKDKIGGGVGGGTWQEDKNKDTAMTEDEDEDGYVYDVYFREEVTAGTEPQTDGESYGVIVFAESEDEAWWYEGADEEDDRSDVYGSDDEDSNAEDYHTNDYPDEPVFPEDEDDEYGMSYGNDFDIEDEYSDSDLDIGSRRWAPWKRRTVPGEEEYDLDDSEEDDEPILRKIVRGAWSLD